MNSKAKTKEHEQLQRHIGTSPLVNFELHQFTQNVPIRVVVNDESHGLENDFLSFIYNLMSSDVGGAMNASEFLDVLDDDTLVEDHVASGHGYNNASPIVKSELLGCLEGLKKRVQSLDQVVNYWDVEDMAMDVQGIPWEYPELRDDLLELRKNRYNSFTNVPNSKELAYDDVNVQLIDNMSMWEFHKFWKTPRPALSHFQLRNGSICLNSRNEVFFNELVSDKTIAADRDDVFTYPVIKKLNLFTGEIKTILELKTDYFDRVSSLSCGNDLLVVGTINGTYHMHNLQTGVTTKKILTTSNNGIINFNKINSQRNHSLFSTNDGHLITMDLATSKRITTASFPWAINFVTIAPFNPNVKHIVGDNMNSYILDDRVSPQIPVNILRGHKDFCFASDWSHDGTSIVSGSQDSTLRLYDVRNLQREKFVIQSDSENSICTVNFNASDNMLAFSESIDHVNVIDLESLQVNEDDYTFDDPGFNGYKQGISVFGKVIGAQFFSHDDEDGETLIVGVGDRSIGGILQYRMESVNKCLDYDFL